MIKIPRESVEYVYVNVVRNGVVITDGVQLALLAEDTRPVVWSDAVIIDGMTAILASAVSDAGAYNVWSRTTNGDETPVIEAGQVYRT